MPRQSDARPPLLDDCWLDEVRERLADAAGLLLCLDFDGTLAPIVDDPDEAALAPCNETLLRRLVDEPDVEVAVVSGRSLADLRERVGVDGVYYAGNHGLEWDDGSGRTVAPDARATRPELERVLEQVDEELADVEGCRIEDKDLTATVHYRHTPDDQRDTVVETVEDIVDEVENLQTSQGRAIVEIRPDVPANKGQVVHRLRETYPDHLPVFIGDDVTDEDGFLAVVDDGYGVLVGDRYDTAATVRVPDTDAVMMLLSWFLQMGVDERGTASPP